VELFHFVFWDERRLEPIVGLLELLMAALAVAVVDEFFPRGKLAEHAGFGFCFARCLEIVHGTVIVF
jgi:hypothetical protein